MLGRTLGIGLALGAGALAAAGVPASAATAPSIHVAHGCYLGGQAVQVTGAGFAPRRRFDLTIDGVDFGQATTNALGGFAVAPGPGGLPAGVAEHVEHLEVTDGTSTATTTFTLTRPAGARLLALSGRANSLKAPFEAWGFGVDGSRPPLYLHYVAPSGRVRTTVSLGRSGGQCGYLRTKPLRVFPFTPSAGRWTLVIDAARAYSNHARGSRARISVRVA